MKLYLAQHVLRLDIVRLFLNQRAKRDLSIIGATITPIEMRANEAAIVLQQWLRVSNRACRSGHHQGLVTRPISHLAEAIPTKREGRVSLQCGLHEIDGFAEFLSIELAFRGQVRAKRIKGLRGLTGAPSERLAWRALGCDQSCQLHLGYTTGSGTQVTDGTA